MSLPLLDQVVQAICQMDVPALHTLLSSSYTYNDVYKDVFISKLDEVFYRYREAGDSHLTASPGQCAGKNCNNCGIKGFRFIGELSRNYLDLLFEWDGTELTDIFNCGLFETLQADVLGKEFDIDIMDDELANFKKDIDHHILLSNAMEALEVLQNLTNHEISYAQLKNWILKYENSYEKMKKRTKPLQKMKWSLFMSVYSKCEEVFQFFEENGPSLKKLLAEMPDEKEEDALIRWTLSCSAFMDLRTLSVSYGLDLIEVHRKKIVHSMQFKGEPFDSFIVLQTLHEKHLSRLLAKYRIYSLQEMDDYLSSDIDFSDLAFHLDQRTKARELGIEYPLYPDGIPPEFDSNHN